jgi:hypothetical protein
MTDETSEASAAGEGSERRRHPRHSQPRLVLRIEERKYRTRDWSLGGFRIAGFHRPVDREEELEGVVTTWTGLFRESFNADVVHSGTGGDLRCRFRELPEALREALNKTK